MVDYRLYTYLYSYKYCILYFIFYICCLLYLIYRILFILSFVSCIIYHVSHIVIISNIMMYDILCWFYLMYDSKLNVSLHSPKWSNWGPSMDLDCTNLLYQGALSRGPSPRSGRLSLPRRKAWSLAQGADLEAAWGVNPSGL